MRYRNISPAVPLPKILRQRAEIRTIDRRGEEEIALVPVGEPFAEVGGKDGEVGAVHHAVEIGVAQQRVFHFDLAGGEARDDAIRAVGVAESVVSAGDQKG